MVQNLNDGNGRAQRVVTRLHRHHRDLLKVWSARGPQHMGVVQLPQEDGLLSEA